VKRLDKECENTIGQRQESTLQEEENEFLYDATVVGVLNLFPLVFSKHENGTDNIQDDSFVIPIASECITFKWNVSHLLSKGCSKLYEEFFQMLF
jgi:hypothetical protein